MKLRLELSREELGRLPIAVIVENLHRAVGERHGGKERKKYLKEFNKKERNIIIYHYKNHFFRWVLSSGFPAKHAFRDVETIDVIKRAGNFFGGL